jgi:hypothetical protein
MKDLRNFVLVAIAGGLAACTPKGANTSATNAPVAAATAVMAASAAAPTAATTVPAAAASAPTTPGGSIEQAATAAVGTTINGEILKTDQSDFYRFDVPLKQRDLAIVRLENKSSTLKPDFKLFNADRSQLSESYDGTAGASTETKLALEPGETFYVGVMNYGSTTGKYTLSVTPQNAFDSHEPNDDALTASAVAIGTAIDGSIMDDKDTDWFKITGATQKTIHVTLDNQSDTLKPDVKIYSATKSQTDEKYDGTAGANLDFTIDVEPGKDFYLQVLSYGSTTGKYRLTTAPNAAAPAAPESKPAG